MAAKEKRCRLQTLSDLLRQIKLLESHHKTTLAEDTFQDLNNYRNQFKALLETNHQRALRKFKALHYSQCNKAGKFLANYLRQRQLKSKLLL